jgi:hypothetical protein
MILLPLLATLALAGAPHPVLAPLDEVYPSLDALYVELHQHPELSLHEQQTAAKLAGCSATVRVRPCSCAPTWTRCR